MDKMTDHVIELLMTWPERKRKIALLHYELDNTVRASKNEMIEAMAFGHGEGYGHTDGYVSDKTFYIALNYQSRAEKVNADLKQEIVTQLVELEQEQRRLEYYVSLLEDRQAKVIKLFYEEKLSQGEVEEIMELSAKTIRKVKNEALDVLAKMYQFVSDLS